MVSEKHEFAFYDTQKALKQYLQTRLSLFELNDEEMVHRITHILRLHPGEVFVLFDETVASRVELISLAKKSLVVKVLGHESLKVQKPLVDWYLPLLERDALENAITNLTVMGASSITFLHTDKTKTKKFILSHQRIHRLMCAAAEQSKQFHLPSFDLKVQSLAYFVESAQKSGGLAVFFDPEGSDMVSWFLSSEKQSRGRLSCLIGPESDLTRDEKSFIRDGNVFFSRLTESILRAEIAVTVAMGIIRSCIRQDV